MDENEVWRAFGGHPEGLNARKWKNPRRAWRQPNSGAKACPMVGSPVGLLPQPVQPAADGARIISYATEDLFAAA
jgi:Mg2+-importing ATPase